MTRSGVADQPERPTLIHRLLAASSEGALAIFRQAAWLLTACNLPAQLRALWRATARDITAPRFHAKRPRKAKSPRPF